jgi:hypothetical protein
LIFKWHKRFADWRDSLADDEREGRPSFRESDAVKTEVRDVINGDQRLTVREVADKCGISKTTAHQILGNDLNMNRVCARWVPRILTAEHLTKRVELRFSQFSGCWLILSVYIIMSFDFPFVRLFGVR